MLILRGLAWRGEVLSGCVGNLMKSIRAAVSCDPLCSPSSHSLLSCSHQGGNWGNQGGQIQHYQQRPQGVSAVMVTVVISPRGISAVMVTIVAYLLEAAVRVPFTYVSGIVMLIGLGNLIKTLSVVTSWSYLFSECAPHYEPGHSLGLGPPLFSGEGCLSCGKYVCGLYYIYIHSHAFKYWSQNFILMLSHICMYIYVCTYTYVHT